MNPQDIRDLIVLRQAATEQLQRCWAKRHLYYPSYSRRQIRSLVRSIRRLRKEIVQ